MKLVDKKILVCIVIFMVISNIIYNQDVYAYHKKYDENEEDKTIITVAVFELGQAFFYDDKKNEYSGYLVDYLNELAVYENIEFEYVFGTWQDALDKASKGLVDVCPFVTKNEERSDAFIFSNHSYGPDGGFLYTNRDDIFYDDFENFDGKKIGFIEGFEIINDFDIFARKNNFTYKAVFFADESSMMNSMEKGYIDMVTAESMQQFHEYRRVARYQMGEYYFASNNKEVMSLINNVMSFQRWYNPDIDLMLYKKYYNLTDNTPVFNRSEMDYINEKKLLTIAVLSNRNVHSKYDYDNNDYIGIEPDIIMKLKELSNLNIKIVDVKKEETLISMVENGLADMAIGITQVGNNEVLSNVVFSDSIIKIPHVLAIRKNEEFIINDNNIIAIPQKCIPIINYVSQEHDNWIVEKSYSTENRLDSLMNYDADCVLMSRYELQYLLQKPEYRELTRYPVDFANFDLGLFISKDLDNNVVSILNKSIEVLKYNYVDLIINKNISNMNYYYTFWDNIVEYKEFVIIILFLLLGLFSILLISYRIQRRKSGELERYVKELNRSNYKLNKAYEKIKEAEKQASEANRIKTDFMARMSHDMRTPMNAIISISDFGVEENRNSKDVDYFKQIKTSSLYLLGLLNDILETQKLESDKIELTETVFSFSTLFNEINNIIRYKALRKHVDFEVDFDYRYDKYNILADKKRLEQVILNIINNAIKYTKPFGKVMWKTRLKKYPKSIKFIHTITDNGVGISEDFQEKMFEAFTQETNEMSDKEFGTGLGLAIVNNIVSLMKGDIKCKSSLGKGTRFTITIEHKISSISMKSSNNSAQMYSNALVGKKILVCEDNIINSKIILKILEKHGIITDLAVNGKEGVEKSISNEYDLILMDIRMPIMDGLEATIEIRRFNSDVPIIAVSANAYEEDIKKSLSVGMNAHLAKPIDKDELFSQLAYWMIERE